MGFYKIFEMFAPLLFASEALLRSAERKKLTIMVIPSISLPEDWSFTFYEGLNRYPDCIFKEKTVAEVGCGNGWISIAIAVKWLPLKVSC